MNTSKSVRLGSIALAVLAATCGQLAADTRFERVTTPGEGSFNGAKGEVRMRLVNTDAAHPPDSGFGVSVATKDGYRLSLDVRAPAGAGAPVYHGEVDMEPARRGTVAFVEYAVMDEGPSGKRVEGPGGIRVARKAPYSFKGRTYRHALGVRARVHVVEPGGPLGKTERDVELFAGFPKLPR